MTVRIEIQQGSILEAAVEAIVNAANSQGWMGGGVAGAIKRAAGTQVEEEAVAQGPTPVGGAILTSGGKTPFRGIIHAPTMERPAMRIPAANVGQATTAALRLAEEEGFATIGLPGMGTGVGGVDHTAAAVSMIRAIRKFPARRLQRVLLVDIDRAMVAAWRQAVAEKEATP
ncbi:MAG: macro domain-containing protein [Candidatus Methylomirabilales bacterium]